MTRKDYPAVAESSFDEVIEIYNRCLQQAYDKYLKGEATYHEKDIFKVHLFFAQLRLTPPNKDETPSSEKSTNQRIGQAAELLLVVLRLSSD